MLSIAINYKIFSKNESVILNCTYVILSRRSDTFNYLETKLMCYF